jgi:hypothetical protein
MLGGRAAPSAPFSSPRRASFSLTTAPSGEHCTLPSAASAAQSSEASAGQPLAATTPRLVALHGTASSAGSTRAATISSSAHASGAEIRPPAIAAAGAFRSGSESRVRGARWAAATSRAAARAQAGVGPAGVTPCARVGPRARGRAWGRGRRGGERGRVRRAGSGYRAFCWALGGVILEGVAFPERRENRGHAAQLSCTAAAAPDFLRGRLSVAARSDPGDAGGTLRAMAQNSAPRAKFDAVFMVRGRCGVHSIARAAVCDTALLDMPRSSNSQLLAGDL